LGFDEADARARPAAAAPDARTAAAPLGVAVVGHSLGAGIASLVAGALPDATRALVMIEAVSLLSRPDDTAPGALRRAAASAAALDGRARAGPRTHASLAAAVAARVATVAGYPGRQFLSPAAATPMVKRGTAPAPTATATATDGVEVEVGVGAAMHGVVFRHDPRVVESSAHYFSEGQVRAFLAAVRSPVGVLLAQHGWPYSVDEVAARLELLRTHAPRLHASSLRGAGHHLHLEPPTRDEVAAWATDFLCTV
jgi:pimeloyl-ACP methyl ester carboxylesterase